MHRWVEAVVEGHRCPEDCRCKSLRLDIVVLLLQSGAQVDATTKDLYTALHIAAKEGQEEVNDVQLKTLTLFLL